MNLLIFVVFIALSSSVSANITMTVCRTEGVDASRWTHITFQEYVEGENHIRRREHVNRGDLHTMPIDTVKMCGCASTSRYRISDTVFFANGSVRLGRDHFEDKYCVVDSDEIEFCLRPAATDVSDVTFQVSLCYNMENITEFWPVIELRYSPCEGVNETLVFDREKMNTSVVHPERACRDTGFNNLTETVFLPDGGIVLFGEVRVDPHHYCLEDFIVSADDVVPQIVYCFPSEPLTEIEIALVVGFSISQVSIVLAIVAFALVRRMRNVHGTNLLSYNISLFFTYLMLTLAFVSKNNHSGIKHGGCYFISIAAPYFQLCSMTWLAIISFDVFMKIQFGGINDLLSNVHVKIIYAALGWFIPAFIVFLGVLADAYEWSVMPNFGTTHCFINDRTGRLVYLYVPISIMLLINIGCFIATVSKIFRTKRHIYAIMRGNASNCTKEEMQLLLYVKLFIIMGLTWIAEVISWGLEEFEGYSNYNFIFTDFINALQGFLVFVVTVCKRDIFRKLSKKLRINYAGDKSSSATHSSSLLNKESVEMQKRHRRTETSDY